MFVDKVKVSIAAGDGGNGYMSFRQEKFVDRGGPDGGDGGNGGDIVAVGSNSENTLSRFRYDKKVLGNNGRDGFRQKKNGRRGEIYELKVPVGTVIYDEDGDVRADITEDGQRVVIAQGGRGGFGNAHFVSSVRQAPKFAEKGEPGEAYEATLELKMIADVGLVGLPNAGKSTLLSVSTNARPEIANYPFTTIRPNLGVLDLSGKRSLLLADIPGLIEGASEGKGLGDDFLRHVERTSVLVHCIDAFSDSVAEDYQTIRAELQNYSKDLAKRPEVVAITKIEGLDEELVKMQVNALKVVAPKVKVFAISAQAHIGLNDLWNEVYKLVSSKKKKQAKEASEKAVISPDFADDKWNLEQIEDGVYQLIGRKLERFALRSDPENEESIRRLKDILRKKGVLHQLKKIGAKPGDKLVFGSKKIMEMEL